MENIIKPHSNSKETYTYWLREIKNNIYTSNGNATLNTTQKMWLSVFKLYYTRYRKGLRECFNNAYGITLELDNEKHIRSKTSTEYALYKWN